MSILVAPLSRVPDLILRLAFHDVHVRGPGSSLSPRDMAKMLDFLGTWATAECLLVHCRAGTGRSTATAFVALCSTATTIDP